MSTSSRKSLDKHVCLKRGESKAEMRAQEKSEKEKIAPFSFEESPKPLQKSLNLVPDSSKVEINKKGSTIAPFNYDDDDE
ncbi:Hypothetical Protein FCC1311_051482 [Hondaea fermentalgiana]|uniref:Uncharacterized protein n=1 Tax=Hondaea fermentalgiana TaxID=2315210 RepID=A0A2R5GDB5_9STRA|nr:Hypothetical Protein FCC1311_051482 [Hondaea fermentalgiana]|eukprot:GBG28927.1 Hypothetical Protein FCC1311_051482 [Hondaea fermentalgiana]